MGVVENINVLSEAEKEILSSIRNLHFGSVEVTIHDSKVVQVSRSEKIRFDKKPSA